MRRSLGSLAALFADMDTLPEKSKRVSIKGR
jgi:hypothetical protein